MKWGNLLEYEYYAEQAQAIAASQEPTVCALFDPETGFKPSGKGQLKFFEWFPLQPEQPEHIPPRWVSAIGGIGCLAGETEINGIPVRELTRSPIKVQTLIGDTWATPAYIKGQANLYRLTLRSGKSVIVTEQHQMLSPTGWHQLRHLGCGSLVACHDNEHDAKEKEISKDCLDRGLGRSHCGDVLPQPISVFCQEWLQQSFSPFYDLQDILCRQPIANLAQEFGSQHPSSRPLSSLAYGESPHRQHQKLCQALYKFLHLCSVELSRSSASQTGFYSQEESLLVLLQNSYRLSKRLLQLLQKTVLFDQDSLFANNAQRSLYNLLSSLQCLLSQREAHAFEALEIRKCVQLLKTLLSNEDSNDRFSSESTHLLKSVNIDPSIWFSANGGNYNSNSYWDVIEAIEYVRYDDFYDLHVPVGNHYLANGIWHHNSGKTRSGAIWAILNSLWNPDIRGLIVSNTFTQLYSSTLIGLLEACEEYGIPYDPMGSSIEESAIKIANSRRVYIGEGRMFWRVLSVGAFIGKSQTGRGAEYQRIWIDEGAYTPEQGFQVLDGRLRSSKGDKCQGLITTSPNGFNWLYYRFADPARKPEIKDIYWMQTFLTIENTHLDSSYVTSLQANYTDEMAQQELEAAFIEASSGKIYKYFSRNNHTLTGADAEALHYDRNLPIHIAFDFNAAPCVAVLAQKRANELHVFKEFFMLDADLWELMADIREFIRAGNPNNQDIHVYGDASGRAKSAVSKMSAWQIVFSELKPLGMQLHKHVPDSNPPVRHRVHAVNILFKANRCFLAMDSVPELVKDLEQLSWDKDSGIDKTDSLRSHLSDAFGYLVYQVFVPKAIAHQVQRGLPSII